MGVTTFSFPTTIHFGPGARSRLAGAVGDAGLTRPLVVTDAGVAGLDWFAALAGGLDGAAVFAGVHGNPTATQVTAGVAAYRAHGADGVVGVGGGAALDVAKAVALLATHPGTLWDYEDGTATRPVTAAVAPVVAVPTTAGTGSEVGRSAVVSDDSTKAKRILFSPHLLARVVVADPELTVGLPAAVTAATGMDALTHNVEAYLARGYHPLCDGIALEGVRLAARHLATAVARPADLDARSGMLMASMMGAVAFQKGLGVVHSTAHALGTHADVHHGLANAVMIDHALAHNVEAVPDRFAALAAAAGLDDTTPAGFLRWLAALKAEIGVPATLAGLGLGEADTERLVALAAADPCHRDNPVPVTGAGFAAVFARALQRPAGPGGRIGPATPPLRSVVNPATGAVVGRYRDDTPATVTGAVAAARRAQPAWAARPLAERLAAGARFRAAVAGHAGELAALLTAETGKPVTQSAAELAGLLPRLDFFLARTGAAVAPREVHRQPGLVEAVTWDPWGVVAAVSAWNYPWFVGTNVIVPALLTGNAVVYKPSELATGTGRALAGLLQDAGVPPDVLAAVVGDGAVGAALVGADVDGVWFTGSHATGTAVARAVAGAGRLIPVQLELGGKDPVYVCDDVDVVAAAVSVAGGAFDNAGQSCCAVERVYVHRRVHDAFLDALVATVEGFRAGDPTDPATYLGPLTRRAQAAVLTAQVDAAVAAGARVLTGGSPETGPGGGTWFRPTVLAGVTTAMAVMRDESFGPVLGVQAVAGDDEAVALMNDTDYGLTAGVYSAEEERARAVLARVDTGTAYWNCCDRVSPHLPWSGRHHSGRGTTLSTLGIQAFAQPRAWHRRSRP